MVTQQALLQVQVSQKANILEIVEGMVTLMPDSIVSYNDTVVFMGVDSFNLLQMAMLEKNWYHYNADKASCDTWELTFPGTCVRIIGVPGLTGTNRLFSGRLSNFFIGMDCESDSDELKVWYSNDDDVVKHSIRFRRGTQVAFPNEIVEFTLA